jgi:hypothetical protein
VELRLAKETMAQTLFLILQPLLVEEVVVQALLVALGQMVLLVDLAVEVLLDLEHLEQVDLEVPQHLAKDLLEDQRLITTVTIRIFRAVAVVARAVQAATVFLEDQQVMVVLV